MYIFYMPHYTTLDTIKQKLRVQDTTIDEELDIYIDEVDGYIDRKIRRKIGVNNEYGYTIQLPLTESTDPAITYDLRTIAADLVEGKFRLKTTNDVTLWKTADEALEEYLDTAFGWAESHQLRMNPTLTLSPTTGIAGSTLNISGTGWAPRIEITVRLIDNNNAYSTLDTTPADVLTDDTGAWTGVSVTIPADNPVSSIKVLCTDKFNSVRRNFTVTG